VLFVEAPSTHVDRVHSHEFASGDKYGVFNHRVAYPSTGVERSSLLLNVPSGVDGREELLAGCPANVPENWRMRMMRVALSEQAAAVTGGA
jgi:hypothetical protein